MEISAIDDSVIPDNIVPSRNSFGSSGRSGMQPSLGEEDSEHIVREREIFLKAALQLLDQEPVSSQITEPDLASTSNGELKNYYFMSFPEFSTSRSSFTSDGTKTPISKDSYDVKQRSKHSTLNVSNADVIRFGFLKKASRSGTFGSSNPSWKNKHVVLRHGNFIYCDEPNLSGFRWGNFDSNSQHNKNEKVIPLVMGSFRCRAFKLRDSNGNCVFEVTLSGGARRLWMAPSEYERDVWIDAIQNATAGNFTEFYGSIDSPEGTYLSPQSVARLGLGLGSNGALPMLLNSFTQSKASDRSNSQHDDDDTESVAQVGCTASWDGQASTYAADIAKFHSIQSYVSKIDNISTYKAFIDKLHICKMELCLPIFFLKSNMGGSESPFWAQNRRDISIPNSQVWKVGCSHLCESYDAVRMNRS